MAVNTREVMFVECQQLLTDRVNGSSEFDCDYPLGTNGILKERNNGTGVDKDYAIKSKREEKKRKPTI